MPAAFASLLHTPFLAWSFSSQLRANEARKNRVYSIFHAFVAVVVVVAFAFAFAFAFAVAVAVAVVVVVVVVVVVLVVCAAAA